MTEEGEVNFVLMKVQPDGMLLCSTLALSYPSRQANCNATVHRLYGLIP